MGLIDKIYNISPIFIQNIMISVSGYLRNRKRYGKTYYEHREFLKKFDELALEEKLEYQKKELVRFIKYAYENSKFYKNLYAGVNINEINSIEDLKKLPVVDKELLRKNMNDVITIKKRGNVVGHTGGTTGTSLVVLYLKEDFMKRMAMLDHFKSRVGFEHLKMKRATFNGKHIIPPGQKKKVYWRYNRACKQMIYSSFYLSEENLKYYVESMNKFKPDAIDGFFSSICDLASFIERHNLKLTFKPIAIFPTSETLTQTGRELIERVFKCKVYDQYASSEGAPFVTECTNQKLHIELSTGVFEHIDNNYNNEILVTSFTTHGTPLIRYRIGDSMEFDNNEKTCGCGNSSLIVNKIEGRSLDYLYTIDGAKINSGNIANLFKNIPNAIIRAQTIQNKLDEIIILLEIDKSKYFKEYDDVLRKEFMHKFGNKMKILIKHVEEIPREKSGKFKLVKNNILNR